MRPLVKVAGGLVLLTGLACAGGALMAQPAGPGDRLQDVKVDEFLFPESGALERNLGILSKLVADGGSASIQGLYGIQLLAGQNYADARQHCSEALSAGPLFEPTYCNALLHHREGRMKEAAAMATAAISLRPGSVAPYILLANVRMSQKDRGGVVAAIEQGLAAIPDRAAFWEWELAKLLEAMGDIDGALQCAGALAKISADDPRVFTQSGDWLKRQGKVQEAIAMYRFALSKASWYQPAALSLLETYRTQQQWIELSRASDDVLRNPQLEVLHPTARAYALQAAESLYRAEMDALDAAHGVRLADLSTLDPVEPSEATEVLLKGVEIALRHGFPEPALPLVGRARQLSPVDTSVVHWSGRIRMALGDLDAAVESFEEAAQAQPSVPVLLDLVRALLAQGKFEDCVRRADEALAFAPDNVEVLLAKARCSRQVRDAAGEKAALDRAVKSSPDNVDVLRELTEYNLHPGGSRKEASAALKRVFALEPYDYRVCLKFVALDESLKELDNAVLGLPACIEAIPPTDVTKRQEAYSLLARMLPRVRAASAVAAVARACRAGVSAGCDDLERLTGRRSDRQESLREEPYRPASRIVPAGGELERLGAQGADFLLLSLAAPGFDALSREEKVLLFYLSRAAIAGDNLLYLQKHRHGLALRTLLETLFLHRSHLPKETVAALHDYLKYVWVNHGNYDHRTGKKILPATLTEEMLRQAMTVLADKGLSLDFLPGQGVDEKLGYVARTVFDPDTEAVLIAQGEGRDIVLESAVNFYDPGVTMEMVSGAEPAVRNGLNVRFALRGGKLVPQKYRVGDVGSEYIQNVVYFLRLALPHAAEGPQRASIEALIRYYETGDEEWFRKHSLDWLKTISRVDYVNGFVEQLGDPRGIIGNYEGMAAFVADAAQVDGLAGAAEYFEKSLPIPEELKRPQVSKPVTNVATVLTGTGDMGPVPWAGYNLPNYTDIRSEVGSKNVVFVNILNARSAKDREKILAEFYLPEQRDVVRKWQDTTDKWMVYLHEVVGHGSGRPAEGLTEDPRTRIGSSFSPIEEARADLVALYFVADPRLAALGAFPAAESGAVLAAAYMSYFQSFLMAYRRFDQAEITQPHNKGRQLIFQYLLAGGEDGKGAYGMTLSERDGKMYVEVVDPVKVREGIAALLARVQGIVSNGDKAGADALIGRFATTYDVRVKENVARRAAALGLAGQTAFVFPRLSPVVDSRGNVVDVRLYNDEDLTQQQLRYSRLQRSRDLD